MEETLLIFVLLMRWEITLTIFIFKRIRMKNELLFGEPPGSDGSAHQNGRIATEIFLKYLNHLQKHSNYTTEKIVLLLVDNHSFMPYFT